jgi:hypothetical protein
MVNSPRQCYTGQLTTSGAAVSVSVHDLLTSALTTVEPVLALVKETFDHVDDLAEDVVADTLKGAFCTIEATLATVVSDLAGLTGKVVKRSVSTTTKRAISNEEVAQTLANLLNGVAGGKCQPFGDIPASNRASNLQPSTSLRVSLRGCPFLDLFLAASTPRSTVSLR